MMSKRQFYDYCSFRRQNHREESYSMETEMNKYKINVLSLQKGTMNCVLKEKLLVRRLKPIIIQIERAYFSLPTQGQIMFKLQLECLTFC